MNLTDDARAVADAQPIIDVHEVPSQETALVAPTTAMVATGGDRDLIPSHGELTVLAQLAVTFAQAGLVPRPLQGKPADVLLVLMTGRGLGIDPLVALRECHPIDGKVTVSPKLKLAIVRQRGLGQVWPDPGNDGQQATWHATRSDDPRGTVYSASYSMDDAKTAGLAGKDNWKKYPRQMLQWRCLPDRAEALTRDGWVHRDKISEGSEILAFDQKGGVLRWTRVLGVNAYEAVQTYRMESTTFAMTATANHRWVVDHVLHGPGEWRTRETTDLDSGQYRILAAAPMADDTPSVIHPDDAGRIGWVLTDGSVQWRGNSPSVTIGQSKHVDAVRALFGDIAMETVAPAKVSIIRGVPYNSKAITRWRMSAMRSRDLLQTFGIATKQDRLDHIPAMLDTAGREAMFHAMNLANGTVRKSGAWQFRTGHQTVLDCWMTLATMLGFRCGRPRFQKGCWSVASSVRPLVASKRLSIVPAAVEPVWCPTTELGTWVTRLDGQITVTGNSLGYLLDVTFGEVGTGLYSADELGAVTDDEGRAVIDVTEVTPLAGIAPAPPPASSIANEVAPDDERSGIKDRIDGLPADAVTELKAMWQREDKDGTPTLWPLAVLPNRQVKAAHALIDAVEKRATAGEWGVWAGRDASPAVESLVASSGSDADGAHLMGDDPECLADGCSESVTIFTDDGEPWCADHAPMTP